MGGTARTQSKKKNHVVRKKQSAYKTSRSQPEFKLVTRREINAVIRKIVDEFNPEKVILFGSYAYGKPTVDSDVDLLVVIESNEHRAQRGVKILNNLLDIPFPMDVLVRTPLEIKRRLNAQDYFMREIVQQGQVVYER